MMRLSNFLLHFLPFFIIISPSHASRATPQSPSTSKIRAVNLGGWLVTEGWIKPSLFDGIPNGDFLDGTRLQLKSVTQNKYLCAESGGGTIIVANRSSASGWETFRLWRITENTFQFRVSNGQFMGLDGGGTDVVAVSDSSDPPETFEIIRNANDSSRVRIKAPNGSFLQAKTDVLVTADYGESTNWRNDDPSVFLMNIVGRLRGEFQITNGYGTKKATPILQEHWNSFIVEEDFKFISQNGLNAVRIPVGWWIAINPTPWPFVEGSLQILDCAFSWAEKYDLKVIIDLHAAPGSQNTFEHSASRDGSQEWGTNDTIAQTVTVIDFLTNRYANSPSFLAMDLLNEPLAPGVTLDTLKKYYQDAYNVVRKYTIDAYVIMGSRLSGSKTELLQFASVLQGSIIDVHYYNVYTTTFNGLSIQENINYLNNNIAAELSTLDSSNGSPLILVGEWVVEWRVNNATKEDYNRFAAAELNVFERASFEWAYWTLKSVQNHWSLEWMITNGYIKITS